MSDVIGIDSRRFSREKVKSDGSRGRFESVLGVAVKVRDYSKFDKLYDRAFADAFGHVGIEKDYKYYCIEDIKAHPWKNALLDRFIRNIARHVDRVHVFYTLFSKTRLKSVKVYGRLSQKRRLKLSSPTRDYEDLLSKHLVQCFPAICAWRLMGYLSPEMTSFHMDSYQGHTFEAQEELEASSFQKIIFPNGDCSNPVISMADLLIEVIDSRLAAQNRLLIFENIRPVLPEFGGKVLVYPISNKHLSKITPLDRENINIQGAMRHPVYWIFKGSDQIDRQTLKKSKGYRNLVDYAAASGAVVKLFDKHIDPKYIKEGDKGVYLNAMGKEIIDSYRKLGKPLEEFKFDMLLPSKGLRER